MDVSSYKKVLFQLDQLVRLLLIDSDDVKSGRLKYWIDYWEGLEKENQEVYDSIYKDM